VKKVVLDHAFKVRLPITIFVILGAFALTYFISRPERDGVGYAPEQPIPFSHKLHAGEMGIDCQYCHTGVTKSRHASIPSASICMNCHVAAKTDSPSIQKLTKHYESGEPIQWKRIHKVPDYAYFNHAAHVNKGVDCKNCHGDVAKMDVVEQVHSFSMGACLTCHRDPHENIPYLNADTIDEGPDNCYACHR